MSVTKYIVSAKRGVNVAKFENFDFGLTVEVEPDDSASVAEQITRTQKAVRAQLESEINRLLADLKLEVPTNG